MIGDVGDISDNDMMTTPTCRLLPVESLSGPENMAADEVLLLSAERGVASLRFYKWSEPTLSLGYFQAEASRQNYTALANTSWVRRPSGGGAILHHRELTYCLALPAGAPWQSGVSWLCKFHKMIASALTALGVFSQIVNAGEETNRGAFLCFLHQTPGDLLVDSKKVVGSAQRKLRGALMQHGSILFEQSPLTPDLPGIAELAGVHIGAEQLPVALARELALSSGWHINPGEWTPAEVSQRNTIAQQKYASVEWNFKR